MKLLKIRIVLTILLLGAVFVYGFAVGFFKIFPYQLIAAAKDYVKQSAGTFETQGHVEEPGAVEVLDTFLHRLLVKKVAIPGFSYGGGGLTNVGDIVYIVSNKGTIHVFDFGDLTKYESNITDVPMNLAGLIKSGHPYKNEFRMHWFRVNGVHSEQDSDGVHTVYVSHNHYDEDTDCITQNVSRTTVQVMAGMASQQGGWNTIFTATPCVDPVPERMLAAAPYPGHISGGVITRFDEQNLLVAIGDYNRHGIGGTEEWGTDPAKPYGKFILLDKVSGDWSAFTTGNRNGSGLYIDSDSVVWSVEVGPEAGDELNILVEDENYGWPKVSYGTWYDPTFELSGGHESGSHPVYKKPVLAWIPSIAPRGLTKVEGEKFPLWSDDLIVGTMRDQSLRRLRLDDDNRVIYDERIHIGHRIRDLRTLRDDRIALVTDDGYLIVIDDGGPVFDEMDSDATGRIASLEDFDRIAIEMTAGQTQAVEDTPEAVYQRYCSTCHNLSERNQIGPHLNALLGREVGSLSGFGYTTSLKSDSRVWDVQLLQAFLMNPDKEFPGTNMPKVNLPQQDLDSLIRLFESQQRAQ